MPLSFKLERSRTCFPAWLPIPACGICAGWVLRPPLPTGWWWCRRGPSRKRPVRQLWKKLRPAVELPFQPLDEGPAGRQVTRPGWPSRSPPSPAFRPRQNLSGYVKFEQTNCRLVLVCVTFFFGKKAFSPSFIFDGKVHAPFFFSKRVLALS